MSLVKSRAARLDSISKSIWTYLKAEIRQEEETIDVMKETLIALTSAVSFFKKERTRSISKQTLNLNHPIKNTLAIISQASLNPLRVPLGSPETVQEQDRNLEISVNISQSKLRTEILKPTEQSPPQISSQLPDKEARQPGNQVSSNQPKKEAVYDFGYESMEPNIEASLKGPKKINIFAERRGSLNPSYQINRVRDHLKEVKSRTPVLSNRRLSSKRGRDQTQAGKSFSRKNSGSMGKPSSQRLFSSLAQFLPPRTPVRTNPQKYTSGEEQTGTFDPRVLDAELPQEAVTSRIALRKNRLAAIKLDQGVSGSPRLDRPRASAQDIRQSEERPMNQGVLSSRNTEPDPRHAHLIDMSPKAERLFLKHSAGYAREPIVDELSNSGKTPSSTVASDGKARTPRLGREPALPQPSEFHANNHSLQRAKLSGETGVLWSERPPDSQAASSRGKAGLEKGTFNSSTSFTKKKSTIN